MPNYVEIGRLGWELAVRCSPKFEEAAVAITEAGTGLLERSGFLSPDALRGLSQFLSPKAAESLPQIQSTIGTTVSNMPAEFNMIGKPRTLQVAGSQRELAVYEPHRNLYINSDGTFAAATPTPSGQQVLVEHFAPKGSYAEMTTARQYYDNLRDPYAEPRGMWSTGHTMLTGVSTNPESRQFIAGFHSLSARPNFQPDPNLVAFIKNSRPVDVAKERVDQQLLARVSTPKAVGWLLGFDHKAGEAIVSFDDWARVGNANVNRSYLIVTSLTNLYPVELRSLQQPAFTAYRNSLGELFGAEQQGSNVRLTPYHAFAIRPSEVGLVKNNNQSLSSALGINSAAGVRAMGGYWTSKGARIPINFN
jgi:hypothetical protein